MTFNRRVQLLTEAAKQSTDNLYALVFHLASAHDEQRLSAAFSLVGAPLAREEEGAARAKRKAGSTPSNGATDCAQILLLKIYYEFPDLVSSFVDASTAVGGMQHTSKVRSFGSCIGNTT